MVMKIITAFALLSVQALDASSVQRGINLHKFSGECAKFQNTPIQYYNIRLKKSPSIQFLTDFEIKVKEDIKEPLMLILEVIKCDSVETLGTCQKFRTFRTENYCDLLNVISDGIAPFISVIRPTWKCPHMKGHYVGENATFDMNAASMFMVGDAFYKTRAEVRTVAKNRLIYCVKFEVSIKTRGY